jgi:hypothetical protein
MRPNRGVEFSVAKKGLSIGNLPDSESKHLHLRLEADRQPVSVGEKRSMCKFLCVLSTALRTGHCAQWELIAAPVEKLRQHGNVAFSASFPSLS